MTKIKIEDWEVWEDLENEYTRNDGFSPIKKTKPKKDKKTWKQLQEDKRTKRSGKKRKVAVLKQQQNKRRQDKRK
jgi:hypothetical protein|tara:strand:- start:1253 stop:1477 length:225 start_codon:yes stop_codon:yes gene_type:complete